MSARLCIDCGEPQKLVRKSVPYPQSGLPNVTLQNVPVWICTNGHEEVEIPNTRGLHELLAHLVIRKPLPLVGSEVRFLRRRVKMTAKEFGQNIGLSAVSVSKFENSKKPISIRRIDLLIRLAVAALIAARDSQPIPADLAPLVTALEQSMDIGEHRLKHNENAAPDKEWEAATV